MATCLPPEPMPLDLVMRRIGKLGALAAVALSLSSCYGVHYQAGHAPTGIHREERAHFFFWGLVGEKEIDLDLLCPEGVSSFGNRATFVDGLVYGLTLGIWAPRTIEVECGRPR